MTARTKRLNDIEKAQQLFNIQNHLDQPLKLFPLFIEFHSISDAIDSTS